MMLTEATQPLRLVMLAVFSQLVKNYRATVKHVRELERSMKAEKYKMAESGLSSADRLTWV